MQWGGVLGLVSARPARRRHRASWPSTPGSSPCWCWPASCRWSSLSAGSPARLAARLRRGPRAGRRRARRGRRVRRRRADGARLRRRRPGRRARIDGAIDRHYRAARPTRRRSTARGLRPRRVRRGAGQRRGGRRRRAARPRRRDHRRPLVAFLFLVTLFVAPVQIATEVLNEAQNAVAGCRRVLDVLDTAPDVRRPGATGRACELPPGPARRALRARRLPLRPGGPAGAATTSTCTIPAAARGSRSWGRPARARRPSPSWSPG